MTLPIVLFCLFALLSAAGAYWIALAARSHRAGALAALIVLAAFVALALALRWLIRQGLGV